MKPSFAAAALFSLFLFSSLCFAVASQQEVLKIGASEVSSLVSVKGDLNFKDFIPGEEYSRAVSVDWNIPSSSLDGIESEKVRVFVKLEPSSNNSFLFFKKNQVRGKEFFFALECMVEHGACSSSSVLSRQVQVFFKAPSGASANDSLVVNASFSPFLSFESSRSLGSFFVFDYLLDDSISKAELFVSHLKNSGLDVSESEQLLASARKKQDLGDAAAAYAYAGQAIELAKLAQLKRFESQQPAPDSLGQFSQGAGAAVDAASSLASGAASSAGAAVPSGDLGQAASSLTGMFAGANAPWFWGVALLLAFSFFYLKKRGDWQDHRLGIVELRDARQGPGQELPKWPRQASRWNSGSSGVFEFDDD